MCRISGFRIMEDRVGSVVGSGFWLGSPGVQDSRKCLGMKSRAWRHGPAEHEHGLSCRRTQMPTRMDEAFGELLPDAVLTLS